MRRPPIRVLDVTGSHEAIGDAHGRAYADEIRAYTDERVRIVAGGSWSGGTVDTGTVLGLVELKDALFELSDDDRDVTLEDLDETMTLGELARQALQHLER